MDPLVMAANHNPEGNWDPMTDYAMMRRNVRSFMSIFEADKPVVCKVHGFCVAGGTDMALCSDLVVAAAECEDRLPAGSRLGFADDFALGAPRWPQRAKRLLMTGDSISGTEAVEWGLAIEAPRQRTSMSAPRF